jgi:hypothetical protein
VNDKGEPAYEIAANGKQCLVFKLGDVYFRYSLDAAYSDEKV